MDANARIRMSNVLYWPQVRLMSIRDYNSQEIISYSLQRSKVALNGGGDVVGISRAELISESGSTAPNVQRNQ